ncbi:SRPBCC family protein [Streptomyces sp. NPDC087218]|uniref:SRPBCC family protein n=1 Tax=unclassified Streptomyces TaxID=2593676 RepID=UPI0036CBF5F0
MPHVSANVHVSRPADEVFSFLRDPRNLAEWSSSIDRVIDGPLAAELGDEYTCKFPGRRRAHRLRCTASAPVEYLVFRGAGMWTPLGRHSPELEFRLSPGRRGTTVTVSVRPHLDGGMIILAPFVTMAWRRDLPSELQCLADLLSGGNGSAPGPGEGVEPGLPGAGAEGDGTGEAVGGSGLGTAPSVG